MRHISGCLVFVVTVLLLGALQLGDIRQILTLFIVCGLNDAHEFLFGDL